MVLLKLKLNRRPLLRNGSHRRPRFDKIKQAAKVVIAEDMGNEANSAEESDEEAIAGEEKKANNWCKNFGIKSSDGTPKVFLCTTAVHECMSSMEQQTVVSVFDASTASNNFITKEQLKKNSIANFRELGVAIVTNELLQDKKYYLGLADQQYFFDKVT
jgi:hypothetical protein